MATWKRICCPVDFSSASRRAMEEAADLAWRFGAELTLVHVDDRPAPSSDGLLSPEEQDEGTAELERKLVAWQEAAEPIAATTVAHALLSGGPADEIARFARDGKYDAIVIATRQKPDRGGGDVASVAEAVVREAPCAVVVVRGEPARR